jgi:hypothetical protein
MNLNPPLTKKGWIHPIVVQKLKSSVFAVLLILGITGNLLANIGVDPAIVEMTLKQGEVQQGTLNVVNNGDEELIVTVEPENWLKKKGYKNKLSEKDPKDWLEVRPMKFKVAPGQPKEIHYKAKAPKDMKGELVAMVFFSSKSKIKSVQRRFGVCFYGTIEGTEDVKCEIVNTTAIEDEQRGKIRFAVEIKNTGNVHVRPYGFINIYNGEDLIKYIRIKKGYPIYPGKTHIFSDECDMKDLPEAFSYQADISYGGIHGSVENMRGPVLSYPVE